jgi:hypothetical protein
MNTPFRTRQGLPVKIIGRKSITSVWALRLTDFALRDYWHSELIAEGGAGQLTEVIAPLPMMRRARAEAVANTEKAAFQSRGALRAEAIIEQAVSEYGRDASDRIDFAGIIDRETAAPELLSACRDALAVLTARGLLGDTNTGRNCAVGDSLREAITKATL